MREGKRERDGIYRQMVLMNLLLIIFPLLVGLSNTWDIKTVPVREI